MAPTMTTVPRERRKLQGWGRTAGSVAEIAAPGSTDELAALVAEAGRRGVIARGLGRSYGDVAQNAGGVVIDMRGVDRLLELDRESGLVTVEAGCSLDALVDAVLAHGWFLPVTPGTSAVTVGGAIACDVHGKNHHRDGAFARHVRSLELVTPEGETITVDPEQQRELFEATAGGLGLTGIVTRATLQLLPVETASMVVDTERAANLDDLLARLASTDHLFRYSVAWVDGRARGAALGRSVLLRGDHATVSDVPRGADRLLRARGRRLSVPPHLSAAPFLRGRPLNAFNELRYRRARPGKSIETIEQFFYPLDAIGNWNRLYGAAGFLQYQFLVPFGAEDTLRTLLESFTAAQPVLVVLKQFGESFGPLGFPAPGWTVALDVATSMPGLARLLDHADEVVAGVGGRVYLAKDSRLRPDLLPRMYPRLEEWRQVQSTIDPEGRMQHDLARRLQLVR
jgi:decaprenylphospho-beta-D-ribofuranose 2-oxidase